MQADLRFGFLRLSTIKNCPHMLKSDHRGLRISEGKFSWWWWVGGGGWWVVWSDHRYSLDLIDDKILIKNPQLNQTLSNGKLSLDWKLYCRLIITLQSQWLWLIKFETSNSIESEPWPPWPSRFPSCDIWFHVNVEMYFTHSQEKQIPIKQLLLEIQMSLVK